MDTKFLAQSGALFELRDSQLKILTAVNDVLDMYNISKTESLSGMQRRISIITSTRIEQQIWCELIKSVIDGVKPEWLRVIGENYIDALPVTDIIGKYCAYIYLLGAILIQEGESITTFSTVLLSCVPYRYKTMIQVQIDNHRSTYGY